jgi:hypothetical protein
MSTSERSAVADLPPAGAPPQEAAGGQPPSVPRPLTGLARFSAYHLYAAGNLLLALVFWFWQVERMPVKVYLAGLVVVAVASFPAARRCSNCCASPSAFSTG